VSRADAPEVPVRISVIGGSRAPAGELELARAVGASIADAGAILVCGGLGGVMEAAARGCCEAGGRTIGLLPGPDPGGANRWIQIPLATGLGEARNALVVRTGEAVISVGGAWGTLSEIGFARAVGRPVITLGRPPADGMELPSAASAADAVAWALEAAREARRID